MEYICTRETYLKVRQAQKDMFEELRSGSKTKAYIEARKLWLQKGPKEEKRYLEVACKECGHHSLKNNPQYPAYEEAFKAWRKEAPLNPELLYNSVEARYLNVFYGILKGRTYTQIEQKVAKDNEINKRFLQELCNRHGVDWNLFEKRMI